MADDAEHRELRRRQVERRQLFGTMTVEENLRMGAYTSPDRAAALADLHAEFDRFLILRERRHQLAQTLSGREQQIVAIARAVMSRPCLLLLDEPSLGLAPMIAAGILVQIGILRDAGTTILVVEPDARAALGIADRGYVTENGRITRIVRGAADNVHRFHNPKLADPASVQHFVSREFHPDRVSERYDWLFEYDALTVPV